mmetsp:Transcript_52522/g.151369  ORF Transcript_52522/g.151369 Transcript_52522/m.151369 type:complete len:216 (+) Transcript_52522:295-942(+)
MREHRRRRWFVAVERLHVPQHQAGWLERRPPVGGDARVVGFGGLRQRRPQRGHLPFPDGAPIRDDEPFRDTARRPRQGAVVPEVALCGAPSHNGVGRGERLGPGVDGAFPARPRHGRHERRQPGIVRALLRRIEEERHRDCWPSTLREMYKLELGIGCTSIDGVLPGHMEIGEGDGATTATDGEAAKRRSGMWRHDDPHVLAGVERSQLCVRRPL